MISAYTYPTRIGRAYLRLIGDRWHVIIGDENLGNYHSPESALDDVVGGHTDSHSSRVDTSTLGLPDELLDWEIVRSR